MNLSTEFMKMKKFDKKNEKNKYKNKWNYKLRSLDENIKNPLKYYKMIPTTQIIFLRPLDEQL